jgi:prepilin-type processing-associated H-X9-DG protein
VNNLKQIGLSFKQWALDNQDRYPMQVLVTNGGTMELVDSGAVWVHFRVMSNELNTPIVVFCPEEKNQNRSFATTFITTTPPVGSVPFTGDTNTSYFVGVDASDLYPGMWLTGDANFRVGTAPLQPGLISLGTNTPIQWNDSRHQDKGNICFADGGVQQLANAIVIQSLRSTGNQTNRLAMP